MRSFLTGLVLALAAAPLAAIDSPPPTMPGWLAGAWEQREGESWSDEFWTPPRAGLMIGAARMGKGDRIDLFEHTRIVRMPDGAIEFVAQPFGNPAVHFPLVASGPQMVQFANAANDYPQRIRYWREGAALKAEISQLDGSRKVGWTFAPMGGG